MALLELQSGFGGTNYSGFSLSDLSPKNETLAQNGLEALIVGRSARLFGRRVPLSREHINRKYATAYMPPIIVSRLFFCGFFFFGGDAREWSIDAEAKLMQRMVWDCDFVPETHLLWASMTLNRTAIFLLCHSRTQPTIGTHCRSSRAKRQASARECTRAHKYYT